MSAYYSDLTKDQEDRLTAKYSTESPLALKLRSNVSDALNLHHKIRFNRSQGAQAGTTVYSSENATTAKY